MLLTAMLFAFGALPAVVHADEPQTAIPAERLEEAKKYYVESAITGFKVGLKIAGAKTLSPKQTEKAGKLIAAWMNDDLIPFLRENGVLEEEFDLLMAPQMDYEEDIPYEDQIKAVQKTAPKTTVKLAKPESQKPIKKPVAVKVQ